jgi:hypothetical protein
MAPFLILIINAFRKVVYVRNGKNAEIDPSPTELLTYKNVQCYHCINPFLVWDWVAKCYFNLDSNWISDTWGYAWILVIVYNSERRAMRKFFTRAISPNPLDSHYGLSQKWTQAFTENRKLKNFFGNPNSTTLHLQTVSRDPKGHQPSTNPATVVKWCGHNVKNKGKWNLSFYNAAP